MPLGRTAYELKSFIEADLQVCSVCRFVKATLEQHIDVLFFERVTDRDTRKAIRDARGFCRVHAGMVARQADALGSSLIFKDVLTNDLRDMDSGAFDRGPGAPNPLARMFDSGPRRGALAPCPLCVREEELEILAADSLLEGLQDASFREAFTTSAGLCMPHFRLARERRSDDGAWAAIIETQRRAVQSLVEQLDEFARKQDYRFKGEQVGKEGLAWQRALDVTSRLTEG